MLVWALDDPLRDGAGSVHQEDVLKALGHPTPLVIAMDGKHLRGTRSGVFSLSGAKGGRKGEEALVFLSALVQGLGLSLGSLPVEGSEGQTAQVALVCWEKPPALPVLGPGGPGLEPLVPRPLPFATCGSRCRPWTNGAGHGAWRATGCRSPGRSGWRS